MAITLKDRERYFDLAHTGAKPLLIKALTLTI